MIKVSAPGKLMLLGEHAVVYNHPCLVTAIDQRLYLNLSQNKSNKITINAPAVKIKNYSVSLLNTHSPKGLKFIIAALKNFNNLCPIKSGLDIATKNGFSINYGFGSSAAVTVAVLFALAKLNNYKLTKRQLFDLAYKTIIDVQGVGSGFDAAAAIYGGTLYFVTAGKTIKPLKINNPPLIIGYTGIKADTSTLIKIVSQKKRNNPEIISRIFADISYLVKKAKKALEKKDYPKVGEYFNFNQGLLESLGVNTPTLSNLIYSAKDAGAYGAKLSGAGGGDCMIALAPKNKIKKVKKAITSAGGKIINVNCCAQGVKLEK